MNITNSFILQFICIMCLSLLPVMAHPTNTYEITIATWNIGHFSMGEKDFSHIKSSDYEAKVEQYRSFIYGPLKVDVLCINEYESEFCQDTIRGCTIAEDVLFDGFTKQRIFKKNRYVCNAIFSNIDQKNIRKKKFKYDSIAKQTINNITWFYYVSADIVIGGDTVKLICTHLINRHEDECQKQMSQLIEEYKSCDKVIICGDMNSSNWSQFKNAGYSLANDGSLVSFPRKSSALDNIIVKGLKISDVRVIKTTLSDHYPVICRISSN